MKSKRVFLQLTQHLRPMGPVLLRLLSLWWRASSRTAGNIVGNRAVVLFLLYLALLYRSTWSTNQDSTQLESIYWRKVREDGNYLQTVIAANVILYKYLFAKTLRALAIAVFVFKRAWAAPLHAAHFVERTSMALQDSIQERVERFLDARLDLIAGKVKELLKDKAMPVFLKNGIDDFVDLLLPDIKLALFNHTDTLLQKRFLSQEQLRKRYEKLQEEQMTMKPRVWERDSKSLDLDTILDSLDEDEIELSPPMFTDVGGEEPTGLLRKIAAAPGSLLDGIYRGFGVIGSRTTQLSRWRSPESTVSADAEEKEEPVVTSGRLQRLFTFTRSLFSRGKPATEQQPVVCSHCGHYTSAEGMVEDIHATLTEGEPPSTLNLEADRNVWQGIERVSPYRILALRRYELHFIVATVGASSEWIIGTIKMMKSGIVGVWYGIPSATQVYMSLLETRGYILYTVSPYDKTFWQNLSNPAYLCFTAVGIIPYLGVLWWFALFMLHDKHDEYQICQFVVGFQTAKFFSQGILLFGFGTLKYYLCSNRVCIEINTCHTDGPRVFRELDFIIFVIQILLVLLNFFLLQYSVPCKMVDKPEHAYLLDVNGDRKDRNRTALKTKTRLGQGGRLGFLLWYFVGVTLVIIFLGLLAFFSGQRDWKLKATFYWLKSLYGLLALPYVVFKLPLMGGLLTATKSTGYTRDGRTVLKVTSSGDFSAEQAPLVEEFLKRLTSKLNFTSSRRSEGHAAAVDEDVSRSIEQTTNEAAEQS